MILSVTLGFCCATVSSADSWWDLGRLADYHPPAWATGKLTDYHPLGWVYHQYGTLTDYHPPYWSHGELTEYHPPNWGYGKLTDHHPPSWVYGKLKDYHPSTWCYGSSRDYHPSGWEYGDLIDFHPSDWQDGAFASHHPSDWAYGTLTDYHPPDWAYGKLTGNHPNDWHEGLLSQYHPSSWVSGRFVDYHPCGDGERNDFVLKAITADIGLNVVPLHLIEGLFASLSEDGIDTFCEQDMSDTTELDPLSLVRLANHVTGQPRYFQPRRDAGTNAMTLLEVEDIRMDQDSKIMMNVVVLMAGVAVAVGVLLVVIFFLGCNLRSHGNADLKYKLIADGCHE